MLKGRLTSIITPNLPPTIFYWNTILNYFDDNVDFMSIYDVRLLVNECERCRCFFNGTRTKELIFAKDGHLVTMNVEREALEISKEEVNPKIYAYLAAFELKVKADEELLDDRDHIVDLNIAMGC